MKKFAHLVSSLSMSLAIVSVASLSGAAEAAGPAKRPAKAAAEAATAEATDATSEADSTKAAAVAPAVKQKKIKYKTGKQVDFDKQTIQGELRRPEISVVTGNEKTTDNGILRLREDFVDRITAHAAEEVE